MPGHRAQGERSPSKPRPEVVCFGMVTPAMVLVVDKLPAWNAGADYTHLTEFISDDAAIIAILLKEWGVQTGLIGTALGNDAMGRNVVRHLHEMGILGEFRLSSNLKTPLELNISDSIGGRTYLWRRDPQVLATLDTADLSPLSQAKMLYVDWYDGDHIMRPLREAKRLGVPVFFNFEHGHTQPEFLSRYAPYVEVCQAVTDESQLRDNASEVASRLLDAGVPTALVTLAGGGCLAATRREWLRMHAPRVKVVDACAAGAAFSAGYQYGLLRDWDMEECLRFAVAAASLSCTKVGPTAFPVAEIRALAASLDVERPLHPSYG